ncbi:toxic anion resistance protein [Selenomonas sp.]|uniref:toxic anion resistance protein n=1 Tax=Selenomonas sp. TaxID=2053611 RepID=UPI002A8419BC|nr:toxic anion resistance protein [Selenomonas sp.]MDY4417431.1 toxic anion resistance protein [Selenomonas sp.]
MAEVKLEDLMGLSEETPAAGATGMPAASPMQQDLLPAQVVETVTRQVEEISPEDRKKIDIIKDKINFKDSNAILNYGAPAQKGVATFSDSVLSSVKKGDSGYVGELLGDLLGKVRSFDVDGSNSKGIAKIPIIGKLVSKGRDLMESYDTLAVQIEKITVQLEKSKDLMMRDINMYDQLYKQNLVYFKALELYIRAGEERVEEMRRDNLPKLRQEAEASNNPMAVQVVADFSDMVDRFEKKVHDLKIAKAVSIQAAPQIRTVQNGDRILADKIQGALYNVIPLWKGQVVMALGLANQQKALQTQRAVTDMTNDLLRKNSEMLKQNSVEVAKENERGIVDIETLHQVNENLISTIEETLQIQQEGRQKRQAAEQELVQIESRLRETIMNAAQQKAGA